MDIFLFLRGSLLHCFHLSMMAESPCRALRAAQSHGDNCDGEVGGLWRGRRSRSASESQQLTREDDKSLRPQVESQWQSMKCRDRSCQFGKIAMSQETTLYLKRSIP